MSDVNNEAPPGVTPLPDQEERERSIVDADEILESLHEAINQLGEREQAALEEVVQRFEKTHDSFVAHQREIINTVQKLQQTGASGAEIQEYLESTAPVLQQNHERYVDSIEEVSEELGEFTDTQKSLSNKQKESLAKQQETFEDLREQQAESSQFQQRFLNNVREQFTQVGGNVLTQTLDAAMGPLKMLTEPLSELTGLDLSAGGILSGLGAAGRGVGRMFGFGSDDGEEETTESATRREAPETPDVETPAQQIIPTPLTGIEPPRQQEEAVPGESPPPAPEPPTPEAIEAPEVEGEIEPPEAPQLPAPEVPETGEIQPPEIGEIETPELQAPSIEPFGEDVLQSPELEPISPPPVEALEPLEAPETPELEPLPAPETPQVDDFPSPEVPTLPTISAPEVEQPEAIALESSAPSDVTREEGAVEPAAEAGEGFSSLAEDLEPLIPSDPLARRLRPDRSLLLREGGVHGAAAVYIGDQIADAELGGEGGEGAVEDEGIVGGAMDTALGMMAGSKLGALASVAGSALSAISIPVLTGVAAGILGYQGGRWALNKLEDMGLHEPLSDEEKERASEEATVSREETDREMSVGSILEGVTPELSSEDDQAPGQVFQGAVSSDQGREEIGQAVRLQAEGRTDEAREFVQSGLQHGSERASELTGEDYTAEDLERTQEQFFEALGEMQERGDIDLDQVSFESKHEDRRPSILPGDGNQGPAEPREDTEFVEADPEDYAGMDLPRKFGEAATRRDRNYHLLINMIENLGMDETEDIILEHGEGEGTNFLGMANDSDADLPRSSEVFFNSPESQEYREDFGVERAGEQYIDDAIVRPDGEVVHTHPDDTIIATQSPVSTFDREVSEGESEAGLDMSMPTNPDTESGPQMVDILSRLLQVMEQKEFSPTINAAPSQPPQQQSSAPVQPRESGNNGSGGIDFDEFRFHNGR